MYVGRCAPDRPFRDKARALERAARAGGTHQKTGTECLGLHTLALSPIPTVWVDTRGGSWGCL